jgi:hypothetical protein
MNIFIDESGSFVSAPKRDSWNCVAAYLSPEIERKHMRSALEVLKRRAGVSITQEIKLRELGERDYLDFLASLGSLQGLLIVVAVDAGLSTLADVKRFRDEQASRIVENVDKMIHESGRTWVKALSDQVRALSPQLFAQLFFQLILLERVVQDGTLYFAQRSPTALGRFRWRIDQKNVARTEYEKAFVVLAPTLLQTMSLTTPLAKLEDADYTFFARFEYAENEKPTYLKDTYGIDAMEGKQMLNIGKLMREDLKFEDSAQNQGVQVADLLASGVRRCLRLQFDDNDKAAELLGALMVEPKVGEPPIRLHAFGKYGTTQTTAGPVGPGVERAVKAMRAKCRPMLVPPRLLARR